MFKSLFSLLFAKASPQTQQTLKHPMVGNALMQPKNQHIALSLKNHCAKSNLIHPDGSWKEHTDEPRLMVISGSGLSVGSGVPTYRSNDGLWLNYDLKKVCNIYTWTEHLTDIQNFYSQLFHTLNDTQSNFGHQVLDGLNCVHYTQNVDNLARYAINIHGHLDHLECPSCQHLWAHQGVVTVHSLCPNCSHTPVKPAVVFFHQSTPMYPILLNTLMGLRKHDVLLVVGTSGEVVPIANWLQTLPIPATKWLYNLERQFKLPEHLFDCVVLGEFNATCFDFKNRWERHQRLQEQEKQLTNT